MPEAGTRVIAVDWSGKKKGAAESIWMAEVADGQVVYLENGLEPNQLVERLIVIAAAYPRVIVGLDFAFSMPAWYLKYHFTTNAPEFWTIVACAGESWLKTCPWPFFDLQQKQKPADCELFRNTEKMAPGAKSVFQIGGPGAVGVGSIRGMPRLSQLRAAGWRIWPFDPPGFPMAIEIYPRLFAPGVTKKFWKERLPHLSKNYPDLNPRYMERAAGSEDAFDAAVSALVMLCAALNNLPGPIDEVERLEGRIWHP